MGSTEALATNLENDGSFIGGGKKEGLRTHLFEVWMIWHPRLHPAGRDQTDDARPLRRDGGVGPDAPCFRVSFPSQYLEPPL